MDSSVERIDPEKAKDLLDSGEGYTYVDVRSEPEFKAGHVPGAVNIPLLEPNPHTGRMEPNPHFLAQVESRFSKDDKIIAGCQRGGRSFKAAEALVASGYKNVLDMRGGYDGELDAAGNISFPGWSRRGLPTTTD